MDQLRALRSVLCRARAMISDEAGFHTDGYAADTEGRWRPVGSADAVRFSAWGAVMRASGGSKVILAAARALFGHATPELARKLDAGTLSHEEALFLLDSAIGAAASDSKLVAGVGGGARDLPS